MSRRRPAIAVSLFLASLLICAGAAAFDFELIVPVRLQALDRSISQAKITCAIYDDTGQQLIGAKQAVFPINSFTGDFSRDIALRFDALPGVDPARATHYRCALDLLLPWADPPWQRPDTASEQPALRPREGTTFSPEVTGPMPAGEPGPLTRPPPYPRRRYAE
jgi:hypothetical protein